MLIVITDQRRVNEPLRFSGQSGHLPSSVSPAAVDWNILHCLVLRVRGYQHQTDSRPGQRAPNCFCRLSLHGLWSYVPNAVGWNICLDVADYFLLNTNPYTNQHFQENRYILKVHDVCVIEFE